MLDLVMELERNGRSLQHFCRELARYFRNLLVVKVAGANTRLIAASAREQERLAEVAAGFSEDDLTRYLQLTLDLFKDLQFSLQPRLHLEIGLLRLIQAGKLVADRRSAGRSGRRWFAATPAPSRKPRRQPPPARRSTAPPVTSHQPPALPANRAVARPPPRRRSSNLACSPPPTPLEHSEVAESNGKLTFHHSRRLSALHERKGYSEDRAESRRAADAIRDSVWNAAGDGGAGCAKTARTMCPNARWRIRK